jgi:hypothetical protein
MFAALRRSIQTCVLAAIASVCLAGSPLAVRADGAVPGKNGNLRHDYGRPHRCEPRVSRAEERCQSARTRAWATFQKCVANVFVEQYRGFCFDTYRAFWSCRHHYFTTWTAFQTNPSVRGSPCSGDRFTDNGDGTVTDNLSLLVWEKKTDDGGVRDIDARHTLSADDSSRGNGTVFTEFLAGLNSQGFAGSSDWRLPTLTELQTIEPDFPCTGGGLERTCQCPVAPCIEAVFGPTQSDGYWARLDFLLAPTQTWAIGFDYGGVEAALNTEDHYVRAVRGGL